jgi:branched-chain amino acid transport system permease protein
MPNSGTPEFGGEGARLRFPRHLVFLLPPLLSILAACSLAVDGEQARICRLALPALEGGGAAVSVTQVLHGREPNSVRVEYRATRPGGAPLPRFAICRFAAEGLSANKAELVGVTTDRGPVSPATIYLLKRYYLETPDALAGDPGPGDPALGLPEVSRGTAYAAEQLLVALPRIAIYGLLASAYALVFGLVGRINLAFGELAALGAAAAGLVVAALSLGGVSSVLPGLALGLAAAMAVAALHGTVAGHVSFRLVPAARSQAGLIATLGLSLALMEYLRLAGGAVPNWIPPVWTEPWRIARAGEFVVTLTPVSVATSGIGFAAAALLVLRMRLSRFGRAWRAASDDALAAALCGVDARRLALTTFAASGALAGLAGALAAVQFGALGFAGGFGLGLKALAAAILGGVGSVAGALIGGLAIGLFETLWTAYLPIEGRDLALFVVLVLFITLKPEGLFGAAPPLKVTS